MDRPFSFALCGLVVAFAAAAGACGKSAERPAPAATKAGAPAPAPEPSPEPKPDALRAISPNAFLAQGTPTFVVGTAGDDVADRGIRGQVELIRGLFFPDAKVVADSDVQAGKWPTYPVVYGGPHVNALMHDLAPGLPFEMDADHLTIGGRTLRGDGVQLITVVPARDDDPKHPEMLLYAGTGTPGVAEINAVSRGADSIVVADAFGPLMTGRWVRGADGAVAAQLGEPAKRIEWREVKRDYATYRFPTDIAAAPNEGELIGAAERGVDSAVHKLGIKQPSPMIFYVYPDVMTKQAITGNAGDGHAVVAARVLHIVGRPELTGIEHLVAHEGTHVVAYYAFGPAGTPFIAEGLAVWAAGEYGGGTLEQWPAHLAGVGELPSVRELLGPTFRKTPERVAYPIAGLLVQAAVELVGIDAVEKDLLGATAATWDDACKRAGTTSAALEAALAQKLTPPPQPSPEP